MQLDVNGRAAHLSVASGAIRAQLPFLVLIHGAGSDHTVWNGQAAKLRRVDANIIAPDLPGHGASAGPALPTIEDMAAWLIALLDLMRAGTLLLAGHSMGTLVALESAGRAPRRTAGLVLLGAAAPMPVNRALLDAAGRHDDAAVDIIMEYGHGPGLQPGRSAGADQMLARTREMLLGSLAGTLAADLNACNGYRRGLEAAAAITCEVTLVTGELDRMTPAAAAQPLVDALARPSQVIVRDCGHMLLSEKPDAVSQALAAALSTCAGDRADT